jgi:hypothetical protein
MEADARGIFITHFGYDLFSPDAKTTLSIVARRKPGTLHVDLSTRDETGAEQWTDFYEGNVHCWALINTAAFMAEDNFVPPPAPPVCPACPPPVPAAAPAPPPPASQPPRASAPAPRTSVPRTVPRSAPSWWEVLRFQVIGGVSGAYGIPPGGSIGPVLMFGARLPLLSFGVGMNGRFSLSEELDGAISVPTSAFTGNAFACLHRKWFFGCALAEVGHLVIAEAGTVVGGERRFNATKADPNFAALGLGLGGEFPITYRFAVRGYLNVTFPTSSRIVAADASDDEKQSVWTSPAVFPTVGIAGVVTF